VLTVSAATDVPPEPTEPAPTREPTREPTRPPAPAADRDTDHGSSEEGQPPPAAPESELEAGATPTGTRRPTRTPRTTVTPTPTPPVTGGLRLTVFSDPPLPAAGGRVVVAVRLENRTAARAADVTLQVVVPDGLLLDAVDGEPGLVARQGPLVRWYLPGLEPGAAESLWLAGVVARAPAEGSALCALLLSAPGSVEHCFVLVVAAVAPTAAEGASVVPEQAAVDQAAVADAGRTLDMGTLGLGVLLLGLGALGVALGLRRQAG